MNESCLCVGLALLVLNETKSRRCLPTVIWSFSAPFKGRLASQSQCVHCERKSDRRRIVWKGSRRKSEVRKNEARFSLWQSNLLYSELLMVGGSPDHISRIWSSCSFAFAPNVDQEKEEHLVINHHSLASTITHPSPWPSPNSLNIVCTTCLLPNCISRKIPVITGSQPRMHTRHNDAGAGSGEILGNCVVVMIGN